MKNSSKLHSRSFIKLQADSNILASPDVGWDIGFHYVLAPQSLPAGQKINIKIK